jgi:hypothetical protein
MLKFGVGPRPLVYDRGELPYEEDRLREGLRLPISTAPDGDAGVPSRESRAAAKSSGERSRRLRRARIVNGVMTLNCVILGFLRLVIMRPLPLGLGAILENPCASDLDSSSGDACSAATVLPHAGYFRPAAVQPQEDQRDQGCISVKCSYLPGIAGLADGVQWRAGPNAGIACCVTEVIAEALDTGHAS